MSPLAPVDPAVRERFEEIVSRGLCSGLKSYDSVCIMGAVNIAARGLSFEKGIADVTDSADCASPRASRFAILLNDKSWSSKQVRAAGLRNLGLALLGSKGIDEDAWARNFCARFIKEILPITFRRVASLKAFEGDTIVGELQAAADTFAAGTPDVARAAAEVARKAREIAWRIRQKHLRTYADAAAAAAFWVLSSPERDGVLTRIANIAAEELEFAKAAASCAAAQPAARGGFREDEQD